MKNDNKIFQSIYTIMNLSLILSIQKFYKWVLKQTLLPVIHQQLFILYIYKTSRLKLVWKLIKNLLININLIGEKGTKSDFVDLWSWLKVIDLNSLI